MCGRRRLRGSGRSKYSHPPSPLGDRTPAKSRELRVTLPACPRNGAASSRSVPPHARPPKAIHEAGGMDGDARMAHRRGAFLAHFNVFVQGCSRVATEGGDFYPPVTAEKVSRGDRRGLALPDRWKDRKLAPQNLRLPKAGSPMGLSRLTSKAMASQSRISLNLSTRSLRSRAAQ